MDSTIILIGPICAGKSTIAELLAEKLAWPTYALDERRWEYYKEIGYDEALAAEIRAIEGMGALVRYWKPFEAYSVVRILADYTHGVIDFGAGHSVYEDETLFRQVEQALAPYSHVLLLLPSPDPGESVQILNDRLTQQLEEEGVVPSEELLQINEHFVKHPSNYRLAKFTFYNKDKSPEATCAEILQTLRERRLLPTKQKDDGLPIMGPAYLTEELGDLDEHRT